MSESLKNARPEEVTETQNSPQAQEKAPQEKSSLVQLEEKLKEAEQKYLYLYAEFENFKKRAAKERLDTLKFGWEGVALELLGVLDNFERALSHLHPETTDKNLMTGLQMIAHGFQAALEKNGVSVVTSSGKVFNPEVHDAISKQNSKEPSGTILEEQLKGYTLHGRLLRPARVVVSEGPAN